MKLQKEEAAKFPLIPLLIKEAITQYQLQKEKRLLWFPLIPLLIKEAIV